MNSPGRPNNRPSFYLTFPPLLYMDFKLQPGGKRVHPQSLLGGVREVSNVAA